MLKKAGVIFCLVVFTFQAVLFNLFLYGSVLTVKLDEDKFSQGLQSVSLTKSQYKKLQWLNEDEISFGNYLIDVKEEKQIGDKIILSYKIDLKEKDFLEKLTENEKSQKKKNATGSSVPFKVSESYSLNFIAQITFLKHVHKTVSVLETQQDKSSPPPKA
jgi:hypothetical protein